MVVTATRGIIATVMKLQIYTSTITASVVTFLFTLTTLIDIQASEASTTTRVTFFCGTRDGVPTTMALASGQTVPIIKWIKRYYPESNEDPLTRCRRVSGIFQTYHQQGILNYITTGVRNGQRIVCAASEAGKPCRRLLYILEPDENPRVEVIRLREILGGRISVGFPASAGSR